MPLGSDFAGGLDDWWQAIAGLGQQPTYDTQLTPEQERAYQAWKLQNAPRDSGADYDLRGAFQAGLSPDPQSGHWPDTFKKPGHPTFSNQSQYAAARPDLAGSWQGDNYIPPVAPSGAEMFRGAVIPASKGFQHETGPAPIDDTGQVYAPNLPPQPGPPQSGSFASQIWKAMQADPTGGVFERGAAPIEAIPNRPKSAQELAAQVSAGRNQVNPLEAILGLGGGPGAAAAAPFLGSASRTLAPQIAGRLPSMGSNLAGSMLTPSGLSSLRQNMEMGGMLQRSRPEVALAAPYVQNPQRVFSPGIYDNPRVIAERAAGNVVPEHPALKELFGVTRNDLWEMSGRGTRQGNMEPQIRTAANPKGSYAADAVMTPQNAQRLVDIGAEAGKHPGLVQGMDPWYVMDPAYQRMVKLVGEEQAKRDYVRFNTVGSMFSPASDVMTELNRGTAANQFAAAGRFPEFMRYGGIAEKNRNRYPGFPDELRDVKAHAYHKTSQAGPVGRYLESGVVDMSQPKVPLYLQASGVPATGFQTKLPVPDAHFTRGVGMADVRTNANPGVSMKTPEYAEFGPWFRENVAKPLGIEAVPAQARQWGTLALETGVDTPIGAGKLELLAQRIWERAQRLGIDPYKLRDDVLMGKEHALWLLGIPAAGAAGSLGSQLGGAATQPEYN